MNRIQFAAGVLAVGVGAGILTGQSSLAGVDAPVNGWPTATGASRTASTADDSTPIALRLFAQGLRSESLDLGEPGTSPGDVSLFEESLSDNAGNVVGYDSVRCETIVSTTRCSATFVITGKGTIEVAGAVATDAYPPLPLAVIGGTGAYENVGGTYRYWAPAPNGTELVFRLDFPETT